MHKKTHSGIMLTLLLVGMLTLAFTIQPAKGEWTGTVYIRADGSIDPPGAPISIVDDVAYTLTGNITSDADGIVVERDHIVIDGAGYMIQGSGVYPSEGIDLSGRTNVTVRNTHIRSFYSGIGRWGSSNNSVSGNDVANNSLGIGLKGSSNYNSISGNDVTNHTLGIYLYQSSNNSFWHNNLIDNAFQANVTTGFVNTWDDSYPSGGNYWSDYEERYPDAGELDDSGIWDRPYEIDEDNQDNYPLMAPYSPLPRTIDELESEIEELGSDGEIDNQGTVTSLLAKLNAAQTLIADEKIDRAKIILNAFINEIHAQSGKHITPEAAELLIHSAEYVFSNL